jgi:hypothetical protein
MTDLQRLLRALLRVADARLQRQLSLWRAHVGGKGGGRRLEALAHRQPQGRALPCIGQGGDMMQTPGMRHYWNADPVNDCQLGTQCPILHARQDGDPRAWSCPLGLWGCLGGWESRRTDKHTCKRCSSVSATAAGLPIPDASEPAHLCRNSGAHWLITTIITEKTD